MTGLKRFQRSFFKERIQCGFSVAHTAPNPYGLQVVTLGTIPDGQCAVAVIDISCRLLTVQ